SVAPSGLMAGTLPLAITAGVPPLAAMDSTLPVQPLLTAKYSVPVAEAEISSPSTPEDTSVCSVAPVAGFSLTSAPPVVTATIPGAVAAGAVAAAPAGPVDEAGTDDGAWVAAGVLLMHADTSIPDAAIPSTSRTGRTAPDQDRHLNEGTWPLRNLFRSRGRRCTLRG